MNTDVIGKVDPGLLTPTDLRRIQLTLQCKDTESLPRVHAAGRVFAGENERYQLMHNGLKVVENGYIGPWVTELIRLLKGFHEPQEEKAFAEILGYIPANASMLELGSWWSYYSMWFQKNIPHAHNIMVEPDINNLMVGMRNFALNGMTGRHVNAAIGKQSIASISYRCYESDNIERPVPVYSLDDLMEREEIKFVDLLLADIQGVELEMLQGATQSIQRGAIRFLVLSTHHHAISHDPLTHQKCLDFLQHYSAKILVEHTVSESFSGDGLIVASLSPQDRDLPTIQVSRNYPRGNLFRETEHDLSDAFAERQALEAALSARESERQGLEAALFAKESERQGLEAALIAKEAERLGGVAALNAKEAERQQLEKALHVRETERLELLTALHAGEAGRLEVQAALNRKEAERLEVQAALTASQADRQQLDRTLADKKVESRRLRAELKSSQVQLQGLEARLSASEADRQGLAAALDAREAERQRLEAVRDATEAERHRLEAALDAKEAERQGSEAALNAKRAELDELQFNRDQVFAELIGVYNSRSFRITRPVRVVFITARRWRDRLSHSPELPEQAAAGRQNAWKGELRRRVEKLRKVPWIAVLLDKFKRRFPRVWFRLARQVKETLPAQSEPSMPVAIVSSDLILSEDERHFLNLFERDGAGRPAKEREAKQ